MKVISKIPNFRFHKLNLKLLAFEIIEIAFYTEWFKNLNLRILRAIFDNNNSIYV
jgi:hypothetical protein